MEREREKKERERVLYISYSSKSYVANRPWEREKEREKSVEIGYFVIFCYLFLTTKTVALRICLLNLYRWGLYQIVYWLTMSGTTPTEAIGNESGGVTRQVGNHKTWMETVAPDKSPWARYPRHSQMTARGWQTVNSPCQHINSSV